MTSESSPSVSGDEASDPKPSPEDQLASLALYETDGQANGAASGSPRENNHHNEIESAEEEVQTNSAAPGLAEAENSGEAVQRGTIGGILWARTNSEPEADRPESPSSSGYAGERGSSSASSVGSGIDEIAEVRDDEVVDGVSDSQAAWVPGKRHVDEVLCSSNSFCNCFALSFCSLCDSLTVFYVFAWSFY